VADLRGSGSGDGYGSGDGSGDGSGSGYGYGSGYGSGSGEWIPQRKGNCVRIGCTTLTIAEWLGSIGQDLAMNHKVDECTIVFLRAQLEFWRDN
jgi:hypothetical protein